MNAVWAPIQLEETGTKVEATTITRSSHIVESHSETHITSMEEHHESHEHVEYSAARVEHSESIHSNESDLVKNVLGTTHHEEQHYDVPPPVEESHYDTPPIEIHKADTVSTRRSSAISEASTLKGVSAAKAHYSFHEESESSTLIAPAKTAQLDSVIEQFKTQYGRDPADAHRMSQSAGGSGAEHETALHRTPDLEFTKNGMEADTTVREFVFVSNDHGSRRSSHSSGGFEHPQYVENKRESNAASEPYFHDLAHDVPLPVPDYDVPHHEPSEHEEDVHFATPPPSSRASFLVESINRDNEMEHRPLEIEHHVPPAPHYNAYDTRRSTGASEQTSHISEESIHIGHTGSAGDLVPNLAGPKVSENLRPVVLPKDSVPPPAPVFPTYASPVKRTPSPTHVHKPPTPLDEVEIHHHHIERRDSRSRHEAAFEEVVHKHEHSHKHEHHHVHHHSSDDGDVVKSYVPLHEEMASSEGVQSLRSKFENKKAPEPNYSFNAYQQVDDDYESIDGYRNADANISTHEQHSTYDVSNSHGVHPNSRDYEHVPATLPSPPPVPKTPPPQFMQTLAFSHDIPHTVFRSNVETGQVKPPHHYDKPVVNSEQRRGQSQSHNGASQHYQEHRDERTHVVEHVYDNVASGDYSHLRVDISSTGAIRHSPQTRSTEHKRDSSPDYAVPYANTPPLHKSLPNSPSPRCASESHSSSHHGYAPPALLPDYELFFNTVHHHYTPSIPKPAEDRRHIERTHHYVPVPPRTTSRERSSSEIHIHNYIPQVKTAEPQTKVVHHHHYIGKSTNTKETKEIIREHHYIPNPVPQLTADSKSEIERHHHFIPKAPSVEKDRRSDSIEREHHFVPPIMTREAQDSKFEADASHHHYIPSVPPKFDHQRKSVDLTSHHYSPAVPSKEDRVKEDDELRRHHFIPPVVNGASRYTEMHIERQHHYLPTVPFTEKSQRTEDLSSHSYLPALPPRERSGSESIHHRHNYIPPIVSHEDPDLRADIHSHHYTPSIPTTEARKSEIEREHGYVPPVAAPRERRNRSEENIHHNYLPAIPSKEYDRLEIQRTHHYQPVAQPLNMEYQRTEKASHEHHYVPQIPLKSEIPDKSDLNRHNFVPALPDKEFKSTEIERSHHFLPVTHVSDDTPRKGLISEHHYIPSVGNKPEDSKEIIREHLYTPFIPPVEERSKKGATGEHHYVPPIQEKSTRDSEIVREHQYAPIIPPKDSNVQRSVISEHHYIPHLGNKPDEEKEIIREHNYTPFIPPTDDKPRKGVISDHHYVPAVQERSTRDSEIMREHQYAPLIPPKDQIPQKGAIPEHHYVPAVQERSARDSEIIREHQYAPIIPQKDQIPQKSAIPEHHFVPLVLEKQNGDHGITREHHFAPLIPSKENGARKDAIADHHYTPFVPGKLDNSREIIRDHQYLPFPTKSEREKSEINPYHSYEPLIPIGERSTRPDIGRHNYEPFVPTKDEIVGQINRSHGYIPAHSRSDDRRDIIHEHSYVPLLQVANQPSANNDIDSHSYVPAVQKFDDRREIIRDHSYLPAPVAGPDAKTSSADMMHHSYVPNLISRANGPAELSLGSHSYLPSAEMELYHNYGSDSNYRQSPITTTANPAPAKWGRPPRTNYPDDTTIFMSESMNQLNRIGDKSRDYSNVTPPSEPSTLVKLEPDDKFPPSEPATFRPQAAPRSQKVDNLQSNDYGGVIRERRRSSGRRPIVPKVFARQPMHSRADTASPKPVPPPVFASTTNAPHNPYERHPSPSRVDSASPRPAPIPVYASVTYAPHATERHSSPSRADALSPKPAPIPIYANTRIAPAAQINDKHVGDDYLNDMQRKQQHVEHAHHQAGHQHKDSDIQYQRQVKEHHDVGGGVKVEKRESAIFQYEHIQIHPKGHRTDSFSPVGHAHTHSTHHDHTHTHAHVHEQPVHIPTKEPIRERAPSRTRLPDKRDSAPVLYEHTGVHQHTETNGYTGVHAHSNKHLPPPEDDHIAPVYALTDRFGGAVRTHKTTQQAPVSPVYEQIQASIITVEQQHQNRTASANSINRPPATTPLHVNTHRHHDYEMHNSVRVVKNVREFVHTWGDKDFVPPPTSPLVGIPRLSNSPRETKHHSHSQARPHPEPAVRSHTPVYAYAAPVYTNTHAHSDRQHHHEHASKRSSVSSGHHHYHDAHNPVPQQTAVSHTDYEAPRRDTVNSQIHGHQVYDSHHEVQRRDHEGSVSQRVDHHEETFELEPVSKRREVFEVRSSGVVRTYSGHKKVRGDIKPLVDMRN
ncbi:hypothetical protein WR25_09220 isoform B [Diploscapter pachys]|uniref:Uncharacterized protein n=1 Tax=Diploscapter pachys TaxID=2018661 RepID=A0A2A2KUA0_9BILA|nr:hypothetical protein WR25_09220 isoform B [Diploscapter pachys]